jgi:hypothetical protein
LRFSWRSLRLCMKKFEKMRKSSYYQKQFIK